MLYYFLVTAFPPLSLKNRPEISFAELKDLLSLNLAPLHLKKMAVLLRMIDLYNIRAFWLGQPLNDKGNFGAMDLEESLLVREDLPSFLIEYLDRYETTQERLRYFPSLYSSFFRDVEEKLRGFLEEYFTFERQQMLVLLALRAKQQGRDLVRELQFEDASDPLVAWILSQKDAPDFTVPKEFEDLKILFVEKGQDPEKLNRAILEYRLAKIEEIEERAVPYSIDQVLGYMARFLIVDSWFQLDEELGRQEVQKLSEYG